MQAPLAAHLATVSAQRVAPGGRNDRRLAARTGAHIFPGCMRDWLRSSRALALATLAAASQTHALDTLSARDLAASCAETGDAQVTDSGACGAYIRGFIDGAIATDPRVTLNVAQELEQKESFGQRAYRTRLGQRLERFGPSYFAGFCIPLPVPLQEIADRVREMLAAEPAVDESARELVYRSLRSYYPCQPDDDQDDG